MKLKGGRGIVIRLADYQERTERRQIKGQRAKI